MTNAYSIVLGIDFTEASEAAIQMGLELSRRVEGDALHLVHVLPALDAKRGDHLARESERIEAAYTELRAYVLEHANKLGKGTWTQDTVFHVRRGDPAEALHQVAIDVDAELVIVGTHQRKGLAKLVLGSVAERLVSMARLPVIVACAKNFEGLEKTETPDPRRPGEDLSDHSERPESRAEQLLLGRRNSHISGLI
jgi:nucleotide-binding universal stress UspA family protein